MVKRDKNKHKSPKIKNKKRDKKGAEAEIFENEIRLLIENFALIQKTLTEVTIAFKQLDKRFNKFLDLVEKAAKEKMEEKKAEEKEDALKKSINESLEKIIEQNKAIAEGMMLLEKLIKEKLKEIGSY